MVIKKLGSQAGPEKPVHSIMQINCSALIMTEIENKGIVVLQCK